jgi:hypothetical protein
MPPYAGKAYEPDSKLVDKLMGGMDISMPASEIAENAFTAVQNLEFYQGVLQSDTGLVSYHGAVRGTPQARFEFQTTAGIIEKLLITTKTCYVDNNAAAQWQYTADGVVNQTLQAATAAGSSSFQITSTASLVVNDYIGIILSDGTQLQTQVQSITDGTHLVATNAVPTGKTAPLGAAFVRAPVLNGVLNFQPVGLMWPTSNILIFTNGQDDIKSFDGTNVQTLAGWTGVTARTIAEFHGFLLLGDTTESGTRFPQRLRNSDQGDPNNASTGLAGFVDLLDTEDYITQLLALGPWIIIYRQNNIMRRSYIGDPLQLFYDEYMVTDFGTFTATAASTSIASHTIMGPQGFFEYNGGYDVEPVGKQVFEYIFGPNGVLNPTAETAIFSFYVQQIDEVWFFVPTASNTACDTLLRYQRITKSWWIRKFPFTFVGFGFCTSAGQSRPWNTQTFPWNTDTKIWASRAGSANTVTVNLLDPVNLQAWNYDFKASNDNGTPITWTAVTKDYQSPIENARLDGLVARGTGNNVSVDVSVDGGQTFVNMGVLNFGLSYTKQNVNLQIVGSSFRFRFSGSDSTFKLDWYRLDFFEESKW